MSQENQKARPKSVTHASKNDKSRMAMSNKDNVFIMQTERALSNINNATESFNTSYINKSLTDRIQKERAQKWKEFSFVIADSYDKVKQELQGLITENAEIKKSNQELQLFNEKIKTLLKECETHNKSMLMAVEKEVKSKKELEVKLEATKKEISDVKAKLTIEQKSKVLLFKTIEKLKKEIATIKIPPDPPLVQIAQCVPVETMKAVENSNENTEFYKKLAEDRMKDCKSLAEQLICLRSDMDQSTTQVIKAKRETMNSSDIAAKSAQKRELRQPNVNLDSGKEMGISPTSESRNAMTELSNNCSDVRPINEFSLKSNVISSPHYPYISTYNANCGYFAKK